MGYAGLIAMLLAGSVFCAAVHLLSSRLASAAQRRAGGRAEAREKEVGTSDDAGVLDSHRPLGRYFFAAALAVVIHSAVFFFYIWGVTLGQTGLVGFVSILCFSACLLIGLIYAWSRGVAGVMKDHPRD